MLYFDIRCVGEARWQLRGSERKVCLFWFKHRKIQDLRTKVRKNKRRRRRREKVRSTGSREEDFSSSLREINRWAQLFFLCLELWIFCWDQLKTYFYKHKLLFEGCEHFFLNTEMSSNQFNGEKKRRLNLISFILGKKKTFWLYSGNETGSCAWCER